jgi:hypothetical protein
LRHEALVQSSHDLAAAAGLHVLLQGSLDILVVGQILQATHQPRELITARMHRRQRGTTGLQRFGTHNTCGQDDRLRTCRSRCHRLTSKMSEHVGDGC